MKTSSSISVISRLDPHVDHIRPVSIDGTNKSHNLHVICSLCNQGKSDGLGVNVNTEIKYAAADINDVPDWHRMRMFYNRLAMDKFKCTICENKCFELTIRPRTTNAPYLLTNLETICVSCLDPNSKTCTATSKSGPNEI